MVESDLSWCGSSRQTRENPFKECITRRKEIRELWKGVAEITGRKEGMKNSTYRGRKGFLAGWGNREG